jgi:hypothetical protein
MAPPDPGKPRETGKKRAVRIPLDYYLHADALTRWKVYLSALALVLALGWWASGFVTSDDGRFHLSADDQRLLRYSRGPVTAVHATWEANCDVCHTPFKPIRGRHWASGSVGNTHGTGGNALCEGCHAGPPHSGKQRSEKVASCAECHREHRGRDASLVRVPDGECTRCHANGSGDSGVKSGEHITCFGEGSHPEFKITTGPKPDDRVSVALANGRDPGQLEFSHKLHMTPGMGLELSLSYIQDEQERERYREGQPKGKKTDQDLIQLGCVTCHRLDSGDFGFKSEQLGQVAVSGALPVRGAGDYLMPITYENQCRACHPLTAKPADDSRAQVITVPHRLQPEEVREFLWGALAKDQVLRRRSEAPQRARRPMPGRDLNEADMRARENIQSRLGTVERFLYQDKLTAAAKLMFLGKQTCGECHRYKRVGTEIVPERIIPPRIPEIWFKHAVFNHAAHRLLDCLRCHAEAQTSEKSSDVLLPGIKTCVPCHSPREYQDGKLRGGARFDCTECHRYHHGDEPLQGIGAARRGAASGVDIDQFLSGKPANP